MGSDEVKPFDVRTNEEFQRLGFTAETRPTIRIEPQEVPETLRQLVPLAERWAIACDLRRGEYLEKQPKEDIRTFWATVELHRAQINRWLDSLSAPVGQWPEAAIHFMYMLKAQSEAVPPEELAKLNGGRRAIIK
jgi:hypothetical protein